MKKINGDFYESENFNIQRIWIDLNKYEWRAYWKISGLLKGYSSTLSGIDGQVGILEGEIGNKK